MIFFFVSDGPTQTHPTVGTVTNVQVTGNVVDYARWGYLNTDDRPSDLVYADNVLATGPSPAIAEGSNPQFGTLNHITGSAVVDSLSGSAVADFIVGGNGGDWISGGGGNDVILSGAGNDFLTGGAGADYFMYTSVAEMGVGFIFIALGGQHATGHGLSRLLEAMAERQEGGYIELQRQEWAPGREVPTASHHRFSGVPYHHLVGKAYDAARLGTEFVEALPDDKVV